jgi:hypothetical protein
MNITCSAPGCRRGLVHQVGGWTDPCKFCSGLGYITFAELCRRIHEHESTVIRILKPDRRMRARTAARILDKLLAVVQ